MTDEFSYYTRYATYGDSGRPAQLGRLHPINVKPPDEARFFGPIYKLTPEQEKRNARVGGNGWHARGVSCIAKELQDECEAAGEVLYPLYAETDKDGASSTSWQALEQFVTSIGVDPSESTCLFSGNRSPHVHIPRLVRGEDDREEVKRIAESVNAAYGREVLDTGIYSRKRAFRIPYVPHAKTGTPKFPIPWGSEHAEIARLYTEIDPNTTHEPMSMGKVLRDVMGTDWSSQVWTPRLVADGAIPDSDQRIIEKPKSAVVGTDEFGVWQMYNRRPYSPYAGANGGNRSLALFRPWRTTLDRGKYLPAEVLAIGANGHTRTDEWETRPIELAPDDRSKVSFDVSKTYVLIGGKSKSSIIFEVSEPDITPVMDDILLRGRQAAFDTLASRGYDVGSAGPKAGCEPGEADVRESSPGNWERRQRAVERGEEHPLDWNHDDLWRFGVSLVVRMGCERSLEWCREHFGGRFDEEKCKEHLGSAARYARDNGRPDLHLPGWAR